MLCKKHRFNLKVGDFDYSHVGSTDRSGTVWQLIALILNLWTRTGRPGFPFFILPLIVSFLFSVTVILIERGTLERL